MVPFHLSPLPRGTVRLVNRGPCDVLVVTIRASHMIGVGYVLYGCMYVQYILYCLGYRDICGGKRKLKTYQNPYTRALPGWGQKKNRMDIDKQRKLDIRIYSSYTSLSQQQFSSLPF